MNEYSKGMEFLVWLIIIADIIVLSLYLVLGIKGGMDKTSAKDTCTTDQRIEVNSNHDEKVEENVGTDSSSNKKVKIYIEND